MEGANIGNFSSINQVTLGKSPVQSIQNPFGGGTQDSRVPSPSVNKQSSRGLLNDKTNSSRSKLKLEKLKNDYNSAMMDDMFPTK